LKLKILRPVRGRRWGLKMALCARGAGRKERLTVSHSNRTEQSCQSSRALDAAGSRVVGHADRGRKRDTEGEKKKEAGVVG